ncbi:MAG TPA: heme exporter protein CcmB [Actinomycetota bacterium]|nr:heme exporter protein CcmB [Actinomycetota bacterium]
MRTLGRLVWKEALVESRGLERASTLLFFGAAVLITLQFALPPGAEARPLAAGGFAWATLLLASMLEVRRTFDSERRDATLDGLRAAPVDPVLILSSKLLASLVLLGALAAVVVPVTAVLFGGDLTRVLEAIGVAVLGLVGVLGWGLLLGAMSGQTRSGELVVPVLLFGLLVPQTIACVRLLGHLLGGAHLESTLTGYVILIGFDLVSVGTSIVLFDYALEE